MDDGRYITANPNKILWISKINKVLDNLVISSKTTCANFGKLDGFK